MSCSWTESPTCVLYSTPSPLYSRIQGSRVQPQFGVAAGRDRVLRYVTSAGGVGTYCMYLPGMCYINYEGSGFRAVEY